MMPKWLSRFPYDLSNSLTAPENCGWHLDGWIDRLSHIYLPGGPFDELVINGVIPKIEDPKFKTSLEVRVDGRTVAGLKLELGTWEVRAPLPQKSESRAIELRFSAAQALPAPDGRTVAALIHGLGLQSAKPDPAPV